MFVLNITVYCICGKKNDCFKYFNPKPQTDSTDSFWDRIDLKFLFKTLATNDTMISFGGIIKLFGTSQMSSSIFGSYFSVQGNGSVCPLFIRVHSLPASVLFIVDFFRLNIPFLVFVVLTIKLTYIKNHSPIHWQIIPAGIDTLQSNS